jgi:hypothetical protein
MNPRAIAVQGIGFAALLVAVQGFAPQQVEQVQAGTPGYHAAAPRPWAADSAGGYIAKIAQPQQAPAPAKAYTAKAAPKPQALAGDQRYTARASKADRAKSEASAYVARKSRSA